MGEVYRATDTKLRRDVAIKILPDDFAHDKERLARFEREARLLASLSHPSIASIYGLEDSDGRPCLVMELVEGETLAESIAAGPLPLEEALTIARRIAEALEAAHEKGIIHRDLKPANVMITPDGDVKILDFGLAKAFEGDTDAGSSVDASLSPTLTVAATRAGVVLGTAAYMSPEQARGRPADKRADIWSFGVVLFEMLTGKRAFTGETISDTLASVLKENPDWKSAPTEPPPVIEALVARCLSKDPRQRLRDIGEARIVLEGVLSSTATGGAAGAAETILAERSTWQRIAPWTLVAVLLAALTVLWSPWQGEPPSPAPIRLRTNISGNQPLFIMRGAAAVLSPDGELLAYVAGVGSERFLNIRSMDQLESTSLSGTEDARHHFFSPDGQWIAFFATGKLKKVSIHGGAPLAISDAAGDRGGTWGRDGTIVFAACSNCGLSRVSSAGGSPAPLTELDETKKERSHRWPSFLADGEHVLFMSLRDSDRSDDGDLEVVSLKTGERKVVHRGGSNPQYVPTGHLTFLREGTLFVAPFDPGHLEVSGPPAPLLEGIMANGGTGQYTFSNTGTFLYLSGSQAGAESTIVWVNRDGKEEPLLPEKGTYEDTRLSPDGNRLAVEINMPGGQDVVWVHDLERGTMTRLTFDAGGSFNPVWTSDGHHLVYGSAVQGDVPSLFVKRADGAGDVNQLTGHNKPTLPYSASPDGRFVAFCLQSGQTNWDIWVLPLEEGEPEPFIATAYLEASPQFSPDSRWLAYTSTESGESEVFVRPYPGPGGRWQISAGGGFAPRWSGDGRKLFFRSGERVMEVDVVAEGDSFQAGRPQVLFEGGYLVGSGMSEAFDVTLDGQRFVMLRPLSSGGGTENNATFIFNWFEEIRRLTEAVGS
jgi:serine/threonine-protein kinase